MSQADPVAQPRPFRERTRAMLHEALFDAARHQLQDRSWAEVTMAEIAAAAGVSRQTLYNEFGSRDEFAQAFVITEGGRFLDEVEDAVRTHPGNPRAALAAALELFLTSAADDPLVRMLVADDGTGGLLPLVTTQSRPIVDWAAHRLEAAIRDQWGRAAPRDVALLSETLVRLAISHVTAPAGSPRQAAAGAVRLLGPFIDEALAA